MRPLRSLIPLLKQQSANSLMREAIWRSWRPWKEAYIRFILDRAGSGVSFRPVQYYRPIPMSTGAESTATIRGYADLICDGSFPFLGYETAKLGVPPQWNIDFISGVEWERRPAKKMKPIVRYDGSDVKVPWELSRLQFLPVLAKAYRRSGEERYRETARMIFADWNEKNPVGIGVNWTLAMESALRGISLCLTMSLLQPFRRDEREWEAMVTRSIWQHLLYTEAHMELSYLIRGNHYLSNIVGLYCMASFLDGPGMLSRRIYYGSMIEQEISRQVYNDGGNYEASFSYHLLTLQMFATAYLVMRADHRAISEAFIIRLRRMFGYLAAVASDSGRVPHVGDSDDGRVELLHSDLWQMIHMAPRERDSLRIPGFLALGDALFDIGCGGDGTECAWYGLRSKEYNPRQEGAAIFLQSGVAVLRKATAQVVFCAIPNGIHGAGSHTHNDKLSLVARLGGVDLLCDSGTLWYTRDVDIRNRYRATVAHNTIAIDGQEQNTLPKDKRFEFSIGNEAAVGPITFSETRQGYCVQARHYGYRRLGVEHQRVVCVGLDHMIIQDMLWGTEEHSFEMLWHVPSPWCVEADGCSAFDIRGPAQVRMCLLSSLPICCSAVPAALSRTYGGTTQSGTTLRIYGRGRFPCTIETYIAWDPEGNRIIRGKKDQGFEICEVVELDREG